MSCALGSRGPARPLKVRDLQFNVPPVRQKFRAIDSDFTALENYPGFGYRWIDAG